MNTKFHPIKPTDWTQWIQWIVSMVIVLVGGTFAVLNYVHSRFATKEDVQSSQATVYRLDDRTQERLKSIENKLDRLIERR